MRGADLSVQASAPHDFWIALPFRIFVGPLVKFPRSRGSMQFRTALALVIGFASSAAAQGGAPPGSSAAPAAGSTLAGVYTEVQAGRGESVFKASCLECHVPSDYEGDAFKAKFVGGTAFDMFEQIRTSMPQSDPGSLSRQQYADLVAYLFQLNALPAGKNELATEADALKAIKVEAKNPQASQATKSTRMGLRHGPPHIR